MSCLVGPGNALQRGKSSPFVATDLPLPNVRRNCIGYILFNRKWGYSAILTVIHGSSELNF